MARASLMTIEELSKTFGFGRTGLVIHGDATFDECEKVGKKLAELEVRSEQEADARQFNIGDFIIYVEEHFSEEASQIVDAELGWKESSLNVYRWVCQEVVVKDRRPELRFEHHKLVARLPREQQVEWLQKAVVGDGNGQRWSTGQLKRALDDFLGMETHRWLLVLDCGSAKARAEAQRALKGVDLKGMTEIDRKRRKKEKQ